MTSCTISQKERKNVYFCVSFFSFLERSWNLQYIFFSLISDDFAHTGEKSDIHIPTVYDTKKTHNNLNVHQKCYNKKSQNVNAKKICCTSVKIALSKHVNDKTHTEPQVDEFKL